MKTRTLQRQSVQVFTACLLALSLILGLTWALTRGAAAQPASAPPAPAPKALRSSNTTAQEIPLGEPGLSFRYVETFGETEVPYFGDSDHINLPPGLATNGTHVWIVESLGSRALEYANDGSFVMQIGKAGVEDATQANLNSLSDVAVDHSGNVWIVGQYPHHVVKFDSSGEFVSELGETWDIVGGEDRFDEPISIAFDAADYAYVSDSRNHRIVVFDGDGTYVTAIGEKGVSGLDDDHFNNPRRITIDSNSLLYVADGDNHRVQIFDVSASPAITHVATLGTSGESGTDNAHFNAPEGVAVDVDGGKIYVADADNQRVQVFDYETRVYEATLDEDLTYVADVAVDDAGNVYVAEPWHSRSQVQQFDSDLNYVRTYGTKGVPYLTDAWHYNAPAGVAVAADGSIYVGEGEGLRLIKLDANGVPQWIVGEAGVYGTDNSHFTFISDVALGPAGRIYVADIVSCRIQIYSSDGSYYATFSGCGPGEDQFSVPSGLTVSPTGNVYVADANSHRVQVFDSNSAYVATLGQAGISGSDNAHFNSPDDVALDSAGNIYVVDRANHRVQVFDSNYDYVRTIGVSGECGDDFGHLCNPTGIAVDTADRVYVSDQWGGRVQVFDGSGAYLTTVGGSTGSLSGQMRSGRNVAVDAAGDLYVTDEDNHRIQKFARGVPDWEQSNLNGFGSPRSLGVPSLATFEDRLYAGTFNTATGAQIWRKSAGGNWTAVITDGFGSRFNTGIGHLIAFKGELFAGTWNHDYGEDRTDGGEVWRSTDGEHWAKIMDQGFGVPSNGEIFRFAVFSDTLYAGTYNYADDRGGEIWRSSTGVAGDWNRVVENGLDNAHNVAVRTFEVYSDTLFAGVSNYEEGGEVWRSSDGLAWTRVMTGGFGSAERVSVPALAAFQDHVYASTSGGAGAQIWRCQVCDGSDWEQVVDDGFGDPNNAQASALTVLDDRLYFVVGNEANGVEVWRTADGADWEQLIAGGFGDSNNAYTGWDNAVTVFDRSLHIGTWNYANGGEVWRQTLHELFLPLVLRSE